MKVVKSDLPVPPPRHLGSKINHNVHKSNSQ
jgi:hypothetical protein